MPGKPAETRIALFGGCERRAAAVQPVVTDHAGLDEIVIAERDDDRDHAGRTIVFAIFRRWRWERYCKQNSLLQAIYPLEQVYLVPECSN